MPPVDRVTVRDFQSIQDLEVAFGAFTVLVGPSNSGKSAFLRAVRACLRNTFVPANVRVGASRSQVTVELADVEPVTIERGKSLSTYKLGTEAFTKSARTVPDAVAKAISMPLIEGSDLNFSFQFDRPFLLAETGSQAAQVLGSLTNVTLLHEAVREANRRRGAASSRLKIRQEDAARFAEQAQEFADLRAEQARLTAAEAELQEIQKESERLSSVQTIVARLDGFTEPELPPEPADVDQEISRLGTEISQLSQIRRLVAQISEQATEVRKLADRARAFKVQADQHEQEYQRMLHDLGVCPTCNRPVA